MSIDDLLGHPFVPDGFRMPGWVAGAGWYARVRDGDRIFLEFVKPKKVIELSIVRRRQPFGGSRAYVQCPRCCGQAVYLYWRHMTFACRRCHRLAYTSQSESVLRRAGRRVRKLKRRIGEGEVRPFRMRRNTFMRLEWELQRRLSKFYELWIPFAQKALKVLRK